MECSGLTTTVNRRLLCETITLKRCCQIPSPDDSESSSDKDCEEQGDDYPTGCDETEAVSTSEGIDNDTDNMTSRYRLSTVSISYRKLVDIEKFCEQIGPTPITGDTWI